MLGGVANPDPRVRRKAVDHLLECVDIMDATGSQDLKLWFADGTNYPGQDDITARQDRLAEALARSTQRLVRRQRMLLEYKLFEPSFYTTDVPDWGTALHALRGARDRGQGRAWTPGTTRRARTSSSSWPCCCGPGSWAGSTSTRRFYADDDLMVGAADPFQLFRIMHEVVAAGALRPGGGHRVHARPVPQHRAEDPGADPLGDERAGGHGQGAAGRHRARWPRPSGPGTCSAPTRCSWTRTTPTSARCSPGCGRTGPGPGSGRRLPALRATPSRSSPTAVGGTPASWGSLETYAPAPTARPHRTRTAAQPPKRTPRHVRAASPTSPACWPAATGSGPTRATPTTRAATPPPRGWPPTR